MEISEVNESKSRNSGKIVFIKPSQAVVKLIANRYVLAMEQAVISDLITSNGSQFGEEASQPHFKWSASFGLNFAHAQYLMIGVIAGLNFNGLRNRDSI